MNCGIYKILNKKNDKVYIGSSIDLHSRENKHFWMLKKNIHDNKFLQSSFNRDGFDNFVFEILERCDLDLLIEKENYYINHYNSNNNNDGYNLATVNEFRRNCYNEEVKIKLSKHNLDKNGNISKFSLTNIKTRETSIFDNLVDASNYLLKGGFTIGKPSNVRAKLSTSLRGIKVNNGYKGSIRKTIYKHEFKLIKQ